MVKFAIWGIGKRGKWLFAILGKERVEVIIDISIKYHNTFYEGISVISPEQYFDYYGECPLIVTPKDSEYLLKDQFAKMGKYHVFCFSDNIYLLEGFLMQAPIQDLIRDYRDKEWIVVYGLNVLGILLYEFLNDKGFSCRLLMQQSVFKNLKGYVKEKLHIETIEWEDVQSCAKRLLLALDIEEQDRPSMNQIHRPVEKYFDLAVRTSLYYYPEIEKFKNIHTNRRCFIVATGPSLRMEDLDKLYKYKEICIGVNGIFKAFNSTKWRPDYYMIDDPNGILQWKEYIIKADIKEKFIADGAWLFKKEEELPNMHKWHYQREFKDNVMPCFSSDFSKVSYAGATIVYDGALQLAAYMGFSEIFLIGVDCCNYLSWDKQYFIQNYDERKSAVNLDVEYNKIAYESAKEYADTHGIKIYNATRGGKLEVFERVNFDELFD